jgi:hypothetical protein
LTIAELDAVSGGSDVSIVQQALTASQTMATISNCLTMTHDTASAVIRNIRECLRHHQNIAAAHSAVPIGILVHLDEKTVKSEARLREAAKHNAVRV